MSGDRSGFASFILEYGLGLRDAEGKPADPEEVVTDCAVALDGRRRWPAATRPSWTLSAPGRFNDGTRAGRAFGQIWDHAYVTTCRDGTMSASFADATFHVDWDRRNNAWFTFVALVGPAPTHMEEAIAPHEEAFDFKWLMEAVGSMRTYRCVRRCNSYTIAAAPGWPDGKVALLDWDEPRTGDGSAAVQAVIDAIAASPVRKPRTAPAGRRTPRSIPFHVRDAARERELLEELRDHLAAHGAARDVVATVEACIAP